MSKITLTGASLFKVSIESGSSGPFCLLRMRADYSGPAREKMDWPELPSGSNLMDLDEAEIPFGILLLTAQQQNLDGSAPACLSLEMSGAETFRVVRVKGKKGAPSYVQVRFNIKSTDTNAAQACFEYKRAVRKSLAELKLTWGSAAKQVPTELELKQEDARTSATSAAMGDRPKKGQPRGRGTQRQQIQDAANQEVVVKVDKEDGEDGDAAADIIARSLASGAGENAENVH